jgi:hypothetical protein
VKIPTEKWVQIVLYRDFFDVPRLVLGRSDDGEFWILDSVFDAEDDDYQDWYGIYSAGSDEGEARANFERHAGGEVRVPGERLLIAAFVFDDSRRVKFKVGVCNGGSPGLARIQ